MCQANQLVATSLPTMTSKEPETISIYSYYLRTFYISYKLLRLQDTPESLYRRCHEQLAKKVGEHLQVDPTHLRFMVRIGDKENRAYFTFKVYASVLPRNSEMFDDSQRLIGHPRCDFSLPYHDTERSF